MTEEPRRDTSMLQLVAAALVLNRLRSRAEDRAALRVPYMILVAQIVIGVAVVTVLIFTPEIDAGFF